MASPAAGSARLTVRYSNGGGVPRPLAVTANGRPITTLTIAPLKNWDTWADAPVTVPLVAGVNAIELTATQDVGGPNVDYIAVAVPAGEVAPLVVPPTPSLPLPDRPGTVLTPPSAVGAETSDRRLAWALGIGGCITLDSAAKDDAAAAATLAKAKAVGLTHLRAFGPSCRVGGSVDWVGHARQVRRLTSRGMKVVIMYGAPEGDAAHTTYAAADWQRYFAGLAAVRTTADAATWIIELQNEINLAHYWPLGGGNVLHPNAVSAIMVVVRAARAALGKDAIIASPSIGWGASVTPHLQYMGAMIDQGLLDQVDWLNTHLYFDTAAEVAAVLDQFAAWAPCRPILLGEVQAAVPLGKFAGLGMPVIDAIHAHNVIPCVYRLEPRGDNEFDDRCLYDARGRRNDLSCAAWGLIQTA